MAYEEERLEAALAAEFTEPTWYPDHGVSHLRSGTRQLDQFERWAWPVPGPYKAVWFAKLEPGGFAVPHIDAGKPFYDRWHIPVVPAGGFWEDGTYLVAPVEPFRVRHWLPHAVWNSGETARIHLMIDRDVVPEDAPPESELALTDMIPEIQKLIEEI